MALVDRLLALARRQQQVSARRDAAFFFFFFFSFSPSLCLSLSPWSARSASARERIRANTRVYAGTFA